MSETIHIDQAGRLVLPKRLRERFRLERGDTLSVEVRGDAIELRPTKARVTLKRVNGVLVLAGGGALPAGRDFVAEARDERLDELTKASGETE
jgi:AbrB family looped-hinge helix DNA binding protein